MSNRKREGLIFGLLFGVFICFFFWGRVLIGHPNPVIAGASHMTISLPFFYGFIWSINELRQGKAYLFTTTFQKNKKPISFYLTAILWIIFFGGLAIFFLFTSIKLLMI